MSVQTLYALHNLFVIRQTQRGIGFKTLKSFAHCGGSATAALPEDCRHHSFADDLRQSRWPLKYDCLKDVVTTADGANAFELFTGHGALQTQRPDLMSFAKNARNHLLYFLVFFAGTLPPSFRASESPIAIACFLLVTFLPLLPLRSSPVFRSRMAFLTLVLAVWPYSSSFHYLSSGFPTEPEKSARVRLHGHLRNLGISGVHK